ncbi:MAG: ABC transporter [Propionibacteriales bacterium]|nr:ABC transporter [Propionibacteriales bacterium]
MSDVVGGMEDMVGRRIDLTARIDGLERAIGAADGRLDETLVSEARRVVEQAGQRLHLSGEHTVVALAGPTGSGKSSLFNAVCGLELAAIGVKRPTTSWALACAWGTDGAEELLEWLDVPPRHHVTRGSLLDPTEADKELQGLVLLDLPDHDSTEVSHHLEVSRLVQTSDLLVWVLDPQKYADNALHERFLRRLAGHADVMLFVFNHIDEVPEEHREILLADARRVMAESGLGDVPMLATSAMTGTGMDLLHTEIARRVREKQTSQARLMTDIEIVSERMSAVTGDARPPDVARQSRAALVDAFAEAAGVSVVVDSVKATSRRRASRLTGWPVMRLVDRFRPDPLQQLEEDLGSEGAQALKQARRESLPAHTSSVQRSRVDATVREVVDEATASLPEEWSRSVRRASVTRLDDVGEALDKAVAETRLGVSQPPLWWHLVYIAQWALLLCAAVGGAWLAVLGVQAYLRVSTSRTPEVAGLWLPLVMFVGGVLIGAALAAVSGLLVMVSARHKASAAEHTLREAIDDVVQSRVVEPIETEIDAYRTCRDGLAVARKS